MSGPGSLHGMTSANSARTYLLLDNVVNISIIMICVKRCK